MPGWRRFPSLMPSFPPARVQETRQCPARLSPLLFGGIFTPDRSTAPREELWQSERGGTALQCRGSPGLVLELESWLKAGAGSVRCFASTWRSRCCAWPFPLPWQVPHGCFPSARWEVLRS